MTLSLVRGVWLTRLELAQHLNVSVRSIERWQREAGLPAHRWSERVYRYSAGEVEAWLRERRAA